MKNVIFKKHYQQYNPGETAGFDDDTADALVEGGAADAGADIVEEAKAKAVKEDPKGK